MLKEAVITPIYIKKESKASLVIINRYLCCHHFQKYLKNNESKIFLDDISFFNKNQYGFRKDMGAESALLEIMDTLANVINNRKKVTGLLFRHFESFRHCAP